MNWGAGVDGGVAVGKVSEFDKTFEVADGWEVKIGGDLTIAGRIVGGKLVVSPSAAFAIPASGASVSYDLDGITSDHELVRWNFSSSAENQPPVDLQWDTYDGYFTITNTSGTTSESIRPVFVLPTALAATTH